MQTDFVDPLEDHPDRFLRLLGRLPLLWAWSVMCFIHCGLVGIVSILEGSFFPGAPRQLVLPLLWNTGWSLSGGIIVPTVWMMLIGFHRHASRALLTLHETRVIESNSIETESNEKILFNSLRQTRTNWICLVGALIVQGWFFWATFTDGLATHNSTPSAGRFERPNPSAIPNIFQAVLSTYLLFLFCDKILRVRAAFRKIVNRSNTIVSVDIFHPDGCGGLLPVGKLAYRLMGPSVMVAGMLFVSHFPMMFLLNRSVTDFSIWMSIAIYFCLSGLTIILPLLPFHRVLDAAKRRGRIDVATSFADWKTGAKKSAPAERIAEMIQFTEAGNIIEKFPVWPFDRATRRRVAALMSLPITFLIPEILTRLSEKYF